MFISDKIDISNSKRTYTDEGYLRVPANLARAGIYDYAAGDIGMPDRDPNDRVKVLRSPEVVFDAESMKSFSLKPVTNGHPSEMVNIANIKKYQVGNSASEIGRNGEFLTSELLITDADMIKAVEDGKCEVSNGYSADFDFTAGSTETGERYDATQNNIRGNHIAIVDNARGGRGCRLSDEKDTENQTMKHMHDGVEIEVTEQGKQVIDKLKTQLKEVNDSLKAKAGEMSTKDAEWQGKLDAEKQKVTDAEAKIVTDADMDKRLDARVVLVAGAKKLSKDFDCSGKNEAEIVRGVVLDVCDGVSDALDGKDDAYSAIYCQSRFDAALAVATADKSDGSEGMKVIGDEEVVDSEAKRIAFRKETESAYMIKEA